MTNRDEFAIRILCALIPHAGTTGAAALTEMSVLLADKLIGSLRPVVPDGRSESKERQAKTDAGVLAVLIKLTQSGFPTGPKRAQWAALCMQALDMGLHDEPIGRRAFDSSRARLLIAGKVEQHGTRFLPVANTPVT